MTDADATGAARGSGQALLAAIAACSNDAIIGKDLAGVVSFWNDAAEALFGFTAAEMIGTPITRIVPANRLWEEADILARIQRGEKLSHFETERITKDGRILPISVTISPIRDAAGRIIGASKIARSLSDVHQAKALAEQNEALLKSILSTVPDGLIVIDQRGTIQSSSLGADRIFGFASGELTGSNIRRLMPKSDAAQHDMYLARYLATGVAHILGIGRTVVGQRKNGSTFPMELQIGEVKLPGVHRFTGFVRDLTAPQARERRVADLQAELIHVSRLAELGQMVSVLAHEVMQPLTAITNYARGAQRIAESAGATTLGPVIDRILGQADRARTIVQNLRGLVKKDASTRTVENLESVIHEAVALALMGSGPTVAVSLSVAPDATRACIDKVQVQQVLLNLIRNAIEAMEDAPDRRLDIAVTRDGDRVRMRIADNGPGLADSVRQNLFQPFVTTKTDGLGIGLSICRTIAQAHGGDLVLEPSERGTVFSFSMPVQAS